MTKASLPAIFKPEPVDFPAVVARVDGLLELWTGDLRGMPVEALESLRATGASDIATGAVGALAAALRQEATEKEIAVALLGLVGAFPQSENKDLSMFGGFMVQDVQSVHPTRMALEAACVHLRRTREFLPSIKVVMETIAEKKAACDGRADLLDKLAPRVALAAEILKDRSGG